MNQPITKPSSGRGNFSSSLIYPFCVPEIGSFVTFPFSESTFSKQAALFTTKNTNPQSGLLEKALCGYLSASNCDINNMMPCKGRLSRYPELGSIGIVLVPGVGKLFLILKSLLKFITQTVLSLWKSLGGYKFLFIHQFKCLPAFIAVHFLQPS